MVIPITLNKSEYVDLDTADPSHINHPDGAELAANIIIAPEGVVLTVVHPKFPDPSVFNT